MSEYQLAAGSSRFEAAIIVATVACLNPFRLRDCLEAGERSPA
jgi:hypothetical protein